MNKFASLAALAILPVLGVLFSTPVFADSPGQLAGGDLYQVRNVTQNTNYGNTAAATCNEVVKFNFKLSNTEYGMLYGVKVSANLQSGSATATATNSANEQVSVTDTATVTLDKGSLSYVAGSTQLYTVEGQLIRNLPDGVVSGGVNAGNLAGSTREFVQFQAKVNCPTPETPETPETPVTPVTPVTPSKPTTPVMPAELPQTGSEGVIAIVASLLTAAAGYVVTARKNLLG